ncbi:MAG: helix-turn-helix transcriptional regulator [Gemmatimonadota bacterium]
MDEKRRKALELKGWKVGDTQEFLGLTEGEVGLIEIKLSLSDGLRRLRSEEALTQEEVASRIGSSQSRVAKMEAADSSVSLDLLVRTLLRLGADRDGIASLLSHPRPRKAAV